jgi:hypothetical protein
MDAFRQINRMNQEQKGSEQIDLEKLQFAQKCNTFKGAAEENVVATQI